MQWLIIQIKKLKVTVMEREKRELMMHASK